MKKILSPPQQYKIILNYRFKFSIKAQEQEQRSTNHKVGDIVEIFMRERQDGSQVTSVGTVTHVCPDRRVKTDICSNYFRPFLRTITRLSTSMILDDTQSQSAHSLSQVF